MDLPSQLFTYDFETDEVIDQAIPLSKNELIFSTGLRPSSIRN